MTILYSTLARVYHEMYQTIFDYNEQFRIYDAYLKKYKIKKVLELGCGSGNLGIRLVQANYNYLGVDLFPEMLAIAQEEFPTIVLVQFIEHDDVRTLGDSIQVGIFRHRARAARFLHGIG